jgi:hypothetical protein
MLVKALKLPVTGKSSASFKDISKNSPMYAIAAAANDAGIIKGANGMFRPGETVSRAQMSAILRRAYELNLTERPYFYDVEPGYWAVNDINAVAKEGVAGGYPEGTFKSGNPVTRAQFSVFLSRAESDDFKLSEPSQKVGLSGEEVTLDRYTYSFSEPTLPINLSNKMERRNNETGNVETLIDSNAYDEFIMPYLREDDGGSGLSGMIDTSRLTVYNDTIYFMIHPEFNWNNIERINQSTLMKMPVSGGKPVPVFKDVYAFGTEEYQQQYRNSQRIVPSRLVRNYTLVDDHIYFIGSRQNYSGHTYFEQSELGNQSTALYRSKLDGTGFEKLLSIKAHQFSSNDNQPDYDAIAFDRQYMYYANSDGIYKMNLTTLKSSRLSSVNAKALEVRGDEVLGTDMKGVVRRLNRWPIPIC